MTFTIHAWKNDQSIVTVRISPAVAVDKARAMERSGWKVHRHGLSGSSVLSFGLRSSLIVCPQRRNSTTSRPKAHATADRKLTAQKACMLFVT
jgi:hypothetical protein